MQTTYFAGQQALLFWLRYFAEVVLFECDHRVDKSAVRLAMDAVETALEPEGFYIPEKLKVAFATINEYLVELGREDRDGKCPDFCAQFDERGPGTILRCHARAPHKVVELRFYHRSFDGFGVALMFSELPELLNPIHWEGATAAWKIRQGPPLPEVLYVNEKDGASFKANLDGFDD